MLTTLSLVLLAAVQCDTQVPNTFQFATAISGDWLVSGRPEGDGPPRVHRREGAAWSAGEVLVPTVVQGGTYYGHAVDIDGPVIAVGRPLANGSKGAVHVFERSGDTWTETAMLMPSDPAGTGHMGWSVAVSGERIAAGCSQTEGRVYVFEKLDGVWTETALLTQSCCAGSQYGRQVALSGDVLLVAAPKYPGAPFQAEGAAFFYRRGPGGWAQEHSVFSGAYSVAVHGSEALIGVTGAVRVLRHGPTGWKLAQVIPSPALSGGFGSAVAIAPGTVVVGDPFLTVGGVVSTGAAYLYKLGQDGFWQHSASFTKPPGFMRYGLFVSTDGERATVSARFALSDVFQTAPAEGLSAAPGTISLSAGGSQALALDGGLFHGGHLYFLVGSASGTSPGTPLDGLVLPLNADAYMLLSIDLAGGPIFSNTLGVLDPCGRASAAIQLPAGSPPALAGTQLHHAYAAFEPGGSAVYVSQSRPLLLTP